MAIVQNCENDKTQYENDEECKRLQNEIKKLENGMFLHKMGKRKGFHRRFYYLDLINNRLVVNSKKCHLGERYCKKQKSVFN